MNEYRHLTEKDKRKISIYKKSKKATKKGIKWWAICTGIVAVFAVGMFAFYKFIDSKSACSASDLSEINSSNAKTDDTQDLNELNKNELERESQKAAVIDKSESDKENKNSEKENTESVENGKVYDFSKWNASCPKSMMVINKDNLISEGMKVSTKVCRGKEVAVECFGDLDSMISDAKKEGINLWISSGYRDINLQTKLFNRQVEREKSKAVISQQEAEKRAAKVVAKPRTSEHNTGLAIDFNGVEDNFYTTKEYKWLMNNAHKYGFIERYQKKWKNYTGVIYEPWHFRYVGKEYAGKIKESGLCLEKYVAENLMK